MNLKTFSLNLFRRFGAFFDALLYAGTYIFVVLHTLFVIAGCFAACCLLLSLIGLVPKS